MLSKQILQSVPRAIRAIRKLSKKSAGPAIAFQQLRMLFLIRDGLGQTDMADAFGVSMPAISKMINTLVEKDFVLREQAQDRRCLNLSLTAKGKKIMNQVSSKLEGELEQKIKNLTKTEKQDLEKGLQILDKLMIEMSEV